MVGILSFNDQKYLEHNLPAILDQDYPNYEVVICNNFEQPEAINQWIKKNFPKVNLVSAGGNVGFGRGHNYIMKTQAKDAKYYLCFNSDMIASKDYLSKLVNVLEQDEEAGVVTGKLLAWNNFPEAPSGLQRNSIDTVGLIAKQNFHIIDKGQGQLDQGQFDEQEEVFGASGASPMFRMEMLKDIQHDEGEYFDKHFFMYKEDVDLAMRVRWAGWKVVYTPDAIAWHDRTASDPGGIIRKITKRRKVPAYIKRNSFLNQLLLTRKNWSPEFSLLTKLMILSFLAKYFAYIILFDIRVLTELKTYFKLAPVFKKRGQSMPRRLSAKQFEKWLV